MSCFDESQALRYVQGLLSPEEQQQVEAHAARCEECRWLLNEAGKAVLVEDSSMATQQDLVEPLEAEPEPAMRRLGEVLSNSYRIERFIGRGGMATVYEASHLRLPRRFAIKFLAEPYAADKIACARIKREAEVTSRLSHPNIVQVTDFDHAPDGTPFIVMELLEGQSLADRIRREGRLKNLQEAAKILEQVCSALAAAHGEQVIHRDLKPSNIFLCRPRGSAVSVKIVDFGLSKVVRRAESWAGEDRPLTSVRSIIGTPSFMAPEQARGDELDVRADLFSLGATIYKMLTGERPFEGSTIKELQASVKRGVRPHPAWEQLPAKVRDVVKRALSSDPERRQRSVAELWAELGPALLEPAGRADRLDVSTTLSVWRRGRATRTAWLAGLGAVGLIAASLLLVARPRSQRVSVRPAVEGAPARSGLVRERQRPNQDARSTPRDAGSNMVAIAVSRPSDTSDAHQRRPPRPRPATGILIVQSKRKQDGRHLWADVFLDGRRMGQSALVLDSVAPGRHLVELRRSGYRPVQRQVRVAAGRKTSALFELEPAQ